MSQSSLPGPMLEIIRVQRVGVLATADPGGRPHCSLMSLLASDDGLSLYLLTGRETRKYRNLLDNPRVSLLLDTRGQPGPEAQVLALTLEGLARTLEDGPRRAQVLERLLARHPQLAQLAALPGAKVVEVRLLSLQLLEGPQRATYLRLDGDDHAE